MVLTRIKSTRELLGLSQAELARRCGLTRQVICGWETGGRQPSLESLLVVAGVLGCTVDELIVKDVVVPDDSS